MQDGKPRAAGAAADAGGSEPPQPKRNIDFIRGKTCFVIMPFGTKKRFPNPHGGTSDQSDEVEIDFDAVYKHIFKPAAEALELVCIRSDEERGGGMIHRSMIDKIVKFDVAIVDITTLNPNVMYELGVRHAAKRTGTVILRHEGDRVPFNINGMRAIGYKADLENPDAEANRRSRELVVEHLYASLMQRDVDSLVHTIFPRLNVSVKPKPLAGRHTFVWRSNKCPEKQFAIIAGDLMKVDTVDAWVNPENTKMEMGRYHDSSVSACIRYFGATRDKAGFVTADKISHEINGKMKPRKAVEAGTAIITGPGALGRTNKVKAIVHVAAQHGEPGNGYVTIRGYPDCVVNALDVIDHYNAGLPTRLRLRPAIETVLFPLFGTQGDRDPQEVTDTIVRAAKDYIEIWPQSRIGRICFLAYTDADQECCTTAFQRMKFTWVGDDPPGWTSDGQPAPAGAPQPQPPSQGTSPQ